jgi:hypothetical protein
MKELALMILLVTTLGSVPAFSEAPPAPPTLPDEPKLVRSLLGQQCVTRFGSCRISPRPINMQCFCGKVPGDVR